MKKLFLSILFVFVVTSASAVFSGNYFCYQFGGETHQNRLYTSTGDVGPHYLGVRLGGVPLYMMLASDTRADVSHFRARVGGITYAGIPVAHAYYTKWGSNGTGNGQFSGIGGVECGWAGVYVSDYVLNRVQLFSQDGTYRLQFGSTGTGDGQFNKAAALASFKTKTSAFGSLRDCDALYVADSQNDRIQIFVVTQSASAFVSKFGSTGTGNGQFDFPSGIALDSNHNVYVVDANNHRVQKFDMNGSYITKWGSAGYGDGQFSTPTSIAIDASDNVYVTDSNRIQKFSASGTYLAKWSVVTPQYISAGADGYIYVSSSYNDVVYKYTSSGTLVSTIGAAGSGDGKFGDISALDCSWGDAYVGDSSLYRVQVFK